MTKHKTLAIALLAISFLSAITVSKKLIRWNFDDYTKLTYEYEQSILTDFLFSKNAPKMIMSGNLLIKIKDEKTADIVLTDVKQSFVTKDSVGNAQVNDITEMPNQVLFQDLTAEGKIDGDIAQSNLILAQTLFPITNQKMKIGETADLKMMMPFNMMGSNINVKGYNRVKYVSSSNGIERLSTIIDVSELTVPEEVEQDFVCYMKGNSDFSFDSNRGVFQEGKITINMAMGNKTNDSTSTNKAAKMMMDLTTEIKLKLIKTE